MKPYLKRTLLLLTVLLLTVGFFSSCDLFGGPEPIAVLGTWTLSSFDWDGDGNDNVEKWVITEDTIEYSSSLDGTTFTVTYKADMFLFDNEGLNGGDTAIVDGGSTLGSGYAVIQYTEVNNAGTGEVGKYQIFRWATNTGNQELRDFTQGYKAANADYDNTVFETPAEAIAGATIANGHFAYASAGAAKQ
ncbi:MAG: hypothetical protein JW760_05150 [Spirochaetales bacterium]|nr:hypothetical protein [Spirochaetales bacterium]